MILYPNPAGYEIFVQSSHEDGGYQYFELYSLQGDLIKKGRLFHDNAIDVKGQARGVYILKLTGDAYKSKVIRVILK